MQHLDEGTIHAWLDGALPMPEAREIEQHVADCTECAAMVAEARGLIAGASRIVSSLDVVRGNVIPKKPAAGGGKSLWRSLHLTPARAALAATLMIAVSTLLTARHNNPSDEMALQRAAAPATSPTNAPRALDAKSGVAPTPAAMPSAGSPAAAPAATVATSAPVKEAPAPREKDRAEPANKPQPEETKAKAASALQQRDVADARAKQTIDSLRVDAAAKSSVVAAAPPALRSQAVGGAGATSANALDTSAKKTLAKIVAADSLQRADAAARNGFAPAFAQRRATLPLSSACFQFAEAPASGLPQRFALGLVSGDTSQHVIRAVNENGRLDSVIAGSNWTRVTSTEITVRFASNDRTVTLPVRDPTLGVASAGGERRESARQSLPTVTRLQCRP